MTPGLEVPVRTTPAWLIAALPLALLACQDDGTSGTDDTTSGTDDTDVVDIYGGCHPLIGDYLIAQGKDPLDATQNSMCFELNTTEPCQRRNGSDGTRVYRYMEDGRVDADGNFSGTEVWFWFGGNQDEWDEDKMDTLSYSGAASERFTGEQLNCVGCEEIYEVERTIVDNQTGTSYATSVVFALDNLNPNGGWQGGEEERNMFVFYGRYNREGQLRDLDTDYAKGQYTPDSMSPGELPADYRWFPQGAAGKCY